MINEFDTRLLVNFGLSKVIAPPETAIFPLKFEPKIVWELCPEYIAPPSIKARLLKNEQFVKETSVFKEKQAPPDEALFSRKIELENDKEELEEEKIDPPCERAELYLKDDLEIYKNIVELLDSK